MTDIISKKTRYEFQEFFVGWTLREIEQEFDAADIERDENFIPNTTGQRRSLVQQYYHSLDFSNRSDMRRLLVVYEHALNHLENRTQHAYDDVAKYAGNRLTELTKWLRKDGLIYQGGRILHMDGDHLPSVEEAVAPFDMPELQRQINRMRVAVEEDPGLAIGTAKELVETTCRTILDERGYPADSNEDIVALIRDTRKILGLMPEDVPNQAKGADLIKRLLSNLGSVAQGLGELRNLYGTGHGRHGKAKGLSPRHARLAVGASATLVTFLLETHVERPMDRKQVPKK